MATQITATLPTLAFPQEVDYPTQEDWAAFSAAAELNFGILGGDWSAQMQNWKDQANAMSTELNTNATIAQGLASYQGDWTSKGYTMGQTVSVSGIYYICKLTHATGQNPTTGGSIYWNLAIGNWYGNFGTGTQSFNGFGGTGFKNLIINGNKQVNQSGLTTTNNAYNYDNHYKVGNNWFNFINGKNIVSGESYTLSWDGVATAGYYIGTAGALTINAQTFIAIDNGETITPTITSGQKLWIKFASDASGSTYNNVQFEPGTTPTPYEQRIYELEENLVQSCYEIGNFWVIGQVPQPNGYIGTTCNFKKNKIANPILSYINVTENANTSSLNISGSVTGIRAWVSANAANTQTIWSAQYVADARPY